MVILLVRCALDPQRDLRAAYGGFHGRAAALGMRRTGLPGHIRLGPFRVAKGPILDLLLRLPSPIQP